MISEIEQEKIKKRFADFVFEETKKLQALGMKEPEAANLVMDTVFVTLHDVWVAAFGYERMAEDFYQVADALVAKSMGEIK